MLQYLDDRAASRALANFARLTRAALYVSALTSEDWRANCDRKRTDRAVHLRPRRMVPAAPQRQFRYLGFGVWLRKDVTAILWDMERSAVGSVEFLLHPGHQRRVHRVTRAGIAAASR